MQNQRNKTLWIWIIPVILIMTWLTVSWLHHDIIWFDEYRSLERIGGGRLTKIGMMDSLLRTLASIWPPFYFMLLYIWDAIIAADAEFTNRAFQLLTGAVAISLIYRTASDMFNRRTGLIAASLLATSVVFLYYIHELRPYIMWVTVIIPTLWLYWRISIRCSDTPGKLELWGFTLLLVLTLYTHHLSPIFVGLIGIYHLLSWSGMDKQQWNKVLWHMVLAGVFYSPGLAIMGQNVLLESGRARPVDRVELLTFASTIFSNGLLPIVILILIYSFRWIHNSGLRFIWFVGGLTVALMIVLDIPVKYLFHPRYLMAGLPALVLIMAYVLEKLWDKWQVLCLSFLILWMISGAMLNATEFLSNVPEDSTMNNSAYAMRTGTMNQIEYTVDNCANPDDFIAFATNTAVEDDIWINPIAYYMFLGRDPNPAIGLVGNLIDLVPGDQIIIEEITLSMDERIDAMLDGHDNVWLMHNPSLNIYDELQRFTDGLLAHDYVNCGAIIHQPELLGTVWTQESSLCQQLLDSCQIPGINQP